MGYALMIAPCFFCRMPFGFHPHKVPSIRDAEGVRQPVCRTCIDRANIERPKRGLPPLQYSKDAYEACDEREL